MEAGRPLRAGCVKRCPGCAHRALSAAASGAQKRDWLTAQLAPWAHAILPIRTTGESGRWNYRDKVCLSTEWRDGGWQFGMVVRDELIPIPCCPIHTERTRRMIAALTPALPPAPRFPLAFYNQAGAQVTLILKTAREPDLSWFTPSLREQLELAGIEGFWLHLHPAAGRRKFAKHGWRLLWGTPRSLDSQGLRYGPTAFQQLLPALYGDALAEAEAYLAPQTGTAVADLYCGVGATLARWTARGAQALGVELGGEAVECAAVNAPQALILRGKCEHRVPQLKEWSNANEARRQWRLLYVNPPRTGIEPAVLAWIGADYRPARLAYLSCSAGTLKRDLLQLCGAGYQVERITPYDFFPQTYHVETLALLRRIP